MSQAGIIDVIESNPEIPITFVEDVGTAMALFNTLNVFGAGGITTSGSGNTIIIDGSGIVGAETITGDTGGPLSPLLGNWNIFAQPQGGASLSFKGAISTLRLNTSDAKANTLIGLNAGNPTLSANGLQNTAYGQNALRASQSDQALVAIGFNSLTNFNGGINNTHVGHSSAANITGGSSNCSLGFMAMMGTSGAAVADTTCIGAFSGQAVTSGIRNTSCGSISFGSLQSGSFNTATGYNSLGQLVTGNFNHCFGYAAGSNYTSSESSNILIGGNAGVLGESNTLRIGVHGSSPNEQSTCYIAGINGNTLSGSPLTVVIDSSTGQLGVSSGGGGGITTIDGDSGSVTGSTITISGGTTGLTTSGSGTTLDLTGTLNVANGGTSATTLTGVLTGHGTSAFTASAVTQHGVVIGGASNAVSSTAVGATGTVLQGNTGANPTYSTATYPSTTTINQILFSSAANTVTGITTKNDGVLITGTTGIPSLLTNGTTGQVLTATTGSPPSWASPSGSSVTIDGDTGSATGSTLTIFSNLATNNCGSTVSFDNTGTTSTFSVTNVGTGSTFIGNGAGNVTGTSNNCTALGISALAAQVSCDNSTAIGRFALFQNIDGTSNTAIGGVAGGQIIHGTDNTCIGQSAGNGQDSTYSIYIGSNSGNNHTGTESNNIIIDSRGILGDNTVIRIGDLPLLSPYTQCYIGGISGSTVTGAAVLCSTSGQLGTVVSSERFKEEITPIICSKITDLTPVSFKYKQSKDTPAHAIDDSIHYGMIAEDVALHMPELVIYDQGLPFTIKYHEMYALLLAEIKALRLEVNLMKK